MELIGSRPDAVLLLTATGCGLREKAPAERKVVKVWWADGRRHCYARLRLLLPRQDPIVIDPTDTPHRHRYRGRPAQLVYQREREL